MILFPDTNFFLQCQVPDQIPWSEVTSDQHVRLLVCRTVQGEVDRFKGDGKGRRSDRARKVSSWFAQVITSGEPIVLRKASPRVTLELPPRIRPGHQYPANLDLSRNDDRIVGEVLAYDDRAASLLTADTGIMMTARHEGLPFISTPDSWRLPPEPDARDRTIAELRKHVAILESSRPVIEVALTHEGKEPIHLGRVTYEPLSDAVIDELVETLRACFPAKTEFPRESDLDYLTSRSSLGGNLGIEGRWGAWQPPSDQAVQDYQDRHAKWLKDVRTHLGRLHRILPGARGRAEMQWSLTNTGTVPAEGLMIEIEACGNLALRDTKAKPEASPPGMPTAPEPPAWTAPTSRLGRLHDATWAMAATTSRASTTEPLAMQGFRDTPRDRHVFYWRDRPVRVLSRRWEFECEEFRHGGTPELFKAIVVTGFDDGAGSGALKVRASARNLPKAFELTTPVPMSVTSDDTEENARALVDTIVRARNMLRPMRRER